MGIHSSHTAKFRILANNHAILGRNGFASVCDTFVVVDNGFIPARLSR